MASTQPSDGSEDVNDFLRRIKELEDRREREDSERTRKLEEDIIQGRKQREARRAERARSLSPEKSSPVATPRSLHSPRSAARPDLPPSPLNTTTTPPVLTNSIESRLDYPSVQEPQKSVENRGTAPRPLPDALNEHENSSAVTARQTTNTVARSSTVSWQQRPSKSDLAQNTSTASSEKPSSENTHEETSLSRLQIAQNLASKDPTWFRQTNDGARGSAAFRRNTQDPETQTRQPTQLRQLAGMSQPVPTVADSTAVETSHIATSSQSVVPQASYIAEQGRSPSPTKGMGGFVQSAMLKRSESVTKRWSAQPTAPTLGNGSRDLAAAAGSQQPAESSTPAGWPKSVESHKEDLYPSEIPPTQTTLPSSRPQTPNTSRDLNPKSSADIADRPPSPSKRWSPMKSTWLESALNKPEVASPPKYAPSQPAWMSQLAKTKQERANRDSASIQTPPPVPLASKPENVQSQDTSPQIPSPNANPQSFTAVSTDQAETAVSPQLSNEASPSKPAKPATPPKKDFRSQLKSSAAQPSPATDDNLEFRNVFGNLKRTQTEKYVAPDELKDNILRGKAALSITGGPQKSARRDELKESLIKQREAMKAKAQEPSANSPLPAAAPTPSIPEAIAKKKAMVERDSSSRAPLVSPVTKAEPREQPLKKAESPGPLRPKPAHALNEAANTFNTNLAGILAKGPPRQNSNEDKPALNVSLSGASDPANNQRNSPKPGQLQHATKARARGPKRRLPNATTSTTENPPSSGVSEKIVSGVTDRATVQREVADTQPLSSNVKPITSRDNSLHSESSKLPSDIENIDSAKEKPKPQSSPLPPSQKDDTLKSKRISVREATAIWGHPHGHVQLSPTRTQPAEQDIKAPSTPADERNSKPTSPIKQENKPGRLQDSPKAANLTANAKAPVQLPPKPTMQEPRTSVPTVQPNHASDAEKALMEFFGRMPTAPSKNDIDVKSIVHSKSTSLNGIQTQRKQMREVGSDGKLLSVSPQEEHILISNRMYLCIHEFLDAQKSSKKEAYLWIGAIVAEAAVEDAQLFARKAAKEAGAPLISVKQGKEPASLFQALGGILITRSGWTKDASSNYMLCGRKHLGYLAFDEVPFTLSSLCSGFPYLIRASSERVFLWKGSGCSTEELSAARLLSMDIGQTGEVQEIEEGKESSEFFALFPSTERAAPKSSEHWKLKGAHDHYTSRLFQVEHTERPISRQNSGTAGIWSLVRRQSQPDLKSPRQTQIKEIAPFMQSDLKSENIYVLDTFFDLYIILGSASNSKPDAFAAALMFAQEYANLSSAADERPHVPVATVVIEGVPKDMKRVFRRWDDDLLQTRNGPTDIGLKRGKTLKLLPLSKALAALGSK